MPKGKQSNVRRVTLDSGPTVTLSFGAADLFAMSPHDRDFVFGLVDMVSSYVSKKKGAALASVKPAAEPAAE